MIIYLSPTPRTPEWFDGYRPLDGTDVGLCRRETHDGQIIGIGDPLLFDSPTDREFRDLDDGWRVAKFGAFDYRLLMRQQHWCEPAEVFTLDGSSWIAPKVLTANGDRAFRVAYGGNDFLPMLTVEQDRVLQVARTAREAVVNDGSLDMPTACRWASILLATMNHVAPGLFAALPLLDDRLVIETLTAATGLPLAREVADADASL